MRSCAALTRAGLPAPLRRSQAKTRGPSDPSANSRGHRKACTGTVRAPVALSAAFQPKQNCRFVRSGTGSIAYDRRMQLCDGGYDLGAELLSVAVGERRAVIRRVPRLDHLWLCEEEAGRALRFVPLGYGEIYKLFDEHGRARYVVAGRLLPEDPPGVAEVRIGLGSGLTMHARIRQRVWVAALPEATSDSDTAELRWFTATGSAYRSDAHCTIRERLGDDDPTTYALLQHA